MRASEIRMPSADNAAVASRSHYPPRAGEPVDWASRLFDSDGWEHLLIDLGGIQVVTRVSFAYAVWDRRTGSCVSQTDAGGEEMRIGNSPLTDVERHKRQLRAQEAVRQMYGHDESAYPAAIRDRLRGG
ncbi:hypothetical protein [Ramlibacter sp. AN1133]|uniref:hypothetical protein n=1 Tax=Ramlibacter sp. AN1133 TaxID=3133429 RepID=UPI0030C2884A